MRRIRWGGLTVGMIAASVSCAACNQGKDDTTYDSIEGTAESIDSSSNEVSMRWYNSRKQREVEVKGRVTDQTEILINGVTSRLEDIRVGEHVKVSGRQVKEGGGRQLIALRIEVTREPTTTATAPVTTVPTDTPVKLK